MNWIHYCIILWITCGVLAYGLSLAYFQRKWLSIAYETYKEDMLHCASMSLLGPADLLATLIFLWQRNGFRHIFMYGFKLY